MTRGSGKSLMGQAGIKHRVRYPDTRNGDRKQGMWRLTIEPIDGLMRGRYIPVGAERLASAPTFLFEPWWRSPVLVDTLDNSFSRSDLVLSCANKDGVHYDPVVPESYAALTRDNSAGWAIANDDGPQIPFDGNPVRVMVRQIGLEVQASLAVSGHLVGRDWRGLYPGAAGAPATA